MFSSQIGSPNSKRFLYRPSVHTPFTFRRRTGPLFPSTPISTQISPDASSTNLFSTPASSPSPATAFSPNFSSATATAERGNYVDYTNVLKWAQDGNLHPIEFFIRHYGGNHSSPPAEWIQAPENLRIDPTDGKAYNIFSFIAEYGGSQTLPPREWLSSSAAADEHIQPVPRQMPWGDNLKTPTSLFRVAPPKLTYPTGSVDENVNAHFVRRALGYLRSSTYVRDVIDWTPRPHPFYNYEPLQIFATNQGYPNYVFDTSTTLETLNWVQQYSPEFERELRLLYNFGDIVSYSNINERIYHIVYGWLNHSTVGGDVHLISGINASDGIFDGVTLLRRVLDSLQVIRTEDVGLQAQRFSRKITNVAFVMRPGGMQAYLGTIDEHRLALVNINRPLSDAEILGRVKATLQGKHSALDTVFREMRLAEHKSGVETTFREAKIKLTDAFRYDIPDSEKTEKAPPAV